MSDKNTGKVVWGFKLVQPPRDLFLSINILLTQAVSAPEQTPSALAPTWKGHSYSVITDYVPSLPHLQENVT